MPIVARPALAWLLLCFASAAQAQERIVPIEQEPGHVLKFQNQHVRFFDVQLQPGYLALWHTHLHDGVFVNIEPSPTSAQDLGGDTRIRPPRMIGETYFINYTREPKSHRVGNVGDTPYRVIDTEILRGCGGFVPVQDAPAQTLIVENERVRVTRLMLAPGEQADLHAPCGMLVGVSAGELAFDSGGPEERMSMTPAGFKWREASTPVRVRNSGTEVFHGVDILVK
ncbi:MAG: hypothetical protein IT532_09835 [Burkholderiales bacterium]|nr:hypothetical protein [Burkholderiales bacterium]